MFSSYSNILRNLDSDKNTSSNNNNNLNLTNNLKEHAGLTNLHQTQLINVHQSIALGMKDVEMNNLDSAINHFEEAKKILDEKSGNDRTTIEEIKRKELKIRIDNIKKIRNKNINPKVTSKKITSQTFSPLSL